jgi:hypothetical protein
MSVLDDPAVIAAKALLNAKVISVEEGVDEMTAEAVEENEVKKPRATKKKATAKKASVGIWGAILEARSLVGPIAKDSHAAIGGRGYNYLSTETVLRDCMPILGQCGLVLCPTDQNFLEKEEGVPMMHMDFLLIHVESNDRMLFRHSLPVENMRTPTKGSLAVRTTALQYVIRDILALPRVEELQPEVDAPDGNRMSRSSGNGRRVPKKPSGPSATDEQMEYIKARQEESDNPSEFAVRLDAQLESKYGCNMETITKEVAEDIIEKFEAKRAEAQ